VSDGTIAVLFDIYLTNMCSCFVMAKSILFFADCDFHCK